MKMITIHNSYFLKLVKTLNVHSSNLTKFHTCICDGLMDLLFPSYVISYYQSYMAQLVDWLYKLFVLTIIHYKSHVRVENDCKFDKIKCSYLQSFNFILLRFKKYDHEFDC